MNFGVNEGRAPELLALLDEALAGGRRHHPRHVPVHPRLHHPRGDAAELGERGRPGGDPRPPAGRRDGRADPAPHGGDGRRRLPRRPHRVGHDRDLGSRPTRRSRRTSAGPSRQSADRRGEAPWVTARRLLARRRARLDDPPARRPRGERPGDHAAPRPHRRLRRHPARRQAAPARVRHLPALSRPVRAGVGRPLAWRSASPTSPSRPAARLRLPDRGLVREGYRADLVLFDPATVAAGSTFEYPRTLPTGIPHVLIDGRFVIEDGRRTDVLAGRAVRRHCPRDRPPARDLTAWAGCTRSRSGRACCRRRSTAGIW